MKKIVKNSKRFRKQKKNSTGKIYIIGFAVLLLLSITILLPKIQQQQIFESQAATPCTGVQISAGQNIQSIVNANPTGTTFCLGAGTYSKQNVTPKTGNVFDGQGAAILDGANSTPRAFGGTAANVTIKNMTIQRYKPATQASAVDCEFGNAWIVQNNIIQNNANVGVNLGDNSIVTGNKLLSNGMEGYSVSGDGSLLEGNEIAFNTPSGDCGTMFECGGGKATVVTSGTIRNNCVHDNKGPGIWMDIDANGMVVENNVVYNNASEGIFFEISKGITIRNNIVADNGQTDATSWLYDSQILISSSQDAKVYGNTVDAPADHGNGITILSQAREYVAINNEIYNNNVTLRGTTFGTMGAESDSGENVAQNSFHNNTYHLANLSNPYWDWLGNEYTFSQVQGVGQESGSTADTILPVKPVLSCDFLNQITPTDQPTPTPTPGGQPSPTVPNTPIPTPTNTPTATPTPFSSSNGLAGSYFANRTLSGSPILVRIDPAVNFNWGTAAPAPTLPFDNFSIRWSGYVVPKYSESYTFYTQSDDGVRLWVNGVRIINNWSDHSSTQNSGRITLTAGRKYSIRIEYYEKKGNALAQLSWKSSSQPKQIIPSSSLFTN